MTRLRRNDIRHITDTLHPYDAQLLKKTGGTLKQIACRAVGVDEKSVRRTQRQYPVAVIPVTSGKGIIEGFVETVRGIAGHLGFPAFLTEETDASGLGEAVGKGAGVLLLSDDHSFLAICPMLNRVIHNSEATGKGFATALAMMMEGLRGKAVLLIGAGRVGKSAALTMAGMGAHLSVYDIDLARSRKLAREIERGLNSSVKVETDLDAALLRHRIYFDASPSPRLIHAEHITAKTFIAAPGMPLGLTSRAQNKVGNRLLHDPLQIGVATMLLDALYGSKEKVLP